MIAPGAIDACVAPIPDATVSDVVARRRAAVDPEALAVAGPIVDAVRSDGEAALRRYAIQFGDLADGALLFVERNALRRELDALGRDDRVRLERVAARIVRFAEAQRASITPVDVAIEGGRAGHRLVPVASAGCYAPGGRHPLPSTVLMTALTARTAGVGRIVVASPRPTRLVMAAAAIAGADVLISAGGPAAIAALAYGAGPSGACAVVCGPGNRYVTAAKYCVSRDVAIDMLAGPSELVIVADDGADPGRVAADLIAQAEHDTDALPILVALPGVDVERVRAAIVEQLADLPTADVARDSLSRRGGTVRVGDLDAAVRAVDAIAPEHLSLQVCDARSMAERFRNYGGLFVGGASNEALGDYGAGPNHTLPTGGTARGRGGLSVFTFLLARTWLEVDGAALDGHLADDVRWLARAERLAGHARSIRNRAGPS